jgi:hypothetical protein
MKKRKIFQTPEEREAWEIRSEATDRMLRDRIAKIEAELRAKDPNHRGIDWWIEQVRAERITRGPVARKRIETPEEREEREIRSEAVDRMLHEWYQREAEKAAKDPNYRGIGYWIDQVRAEREAQNAA